MMMLLLKVIINKIKNDLFYQIFNLNSGLAKAFEDSLHYNSTLVDIIKNHFGVTDLNSPSFKMAYVSTLRF